MLPSSFGCGLGLRGLHFRGHLCVHSRYGPVTRRPPFYDGRVDGLQGISSLPPCHPNYGVLALSPAGLSPAERASLCWTHNRTCDSHRIRLSMCSCRRTATRIGRRPLVQLCLHREYSGLRFTRGWPQIADIHQRPPRSMSLLRAHWTPSPCTRLSQCSDYYGSSVPLRQRRPATDLPRYARLAVAPAGTNGVVPTFTLEPFNGVGAQLCPCNLATATPQSWTHLPGSPYLPRRE